jgi:glycine/D-amino acid oxidase-like deaminating enzyme
MIQDQNYWLTTAEMPKVNAARALPEMADVAVIGAGFTGLSAARTLAKKGANVVVLESQTIGWGASSRNGGMVLSGLKLGVSQLISMYGRDRTQQMYKASLGSIDCVEEIVREESVACDFSRCGHLEVACKQKHFDDYARQAEVVRREFNHELKIIPRNELRSELVTWPGSERRRSGQAHVFTRRLELKRLSAAAGRGPQAGRLALHGGLSGLGMFSSEPADIQAKSRPRSRKKSFPLVPTSLRPKYCLRCWRAS